MLLVKTIKKLSGLYGGPLMLPEASDGFLNLSSVELTQNQKELLNLGINCHVQTKYDPLEKKANLEVLYQDIVQLEQNKKIAVHDDLKTLLAAEGRKVKDSTRSALLSDDLRQAARELRDNDAIVIRRADKSSNFVILDKDDYITKMDSILSDKTKFTAVQRNNTKEFQAKVNQLIYAANALIGGVHFEPIIGDYTPGYAYGNVKTHKTGNPLRPIISQVPTPTYQLAKRLNQLITPYLPNQYCLKPTGDFVDIIHSSEPSGIMASLDVESLFTNVPVSETVDIILDCVYNHPTLPPLKLTSNLLKSMLLACTSEAL